MFLKNILACELHRAGGSDTVAWLSILKGGKVETYDLLGLQCLLLKN